MRVLGDRVIVSPISLAERLQEESTQLVLPSVGAETMARAKEYRIGVVVGVGPGKLLDDGSKDPPPVAKGDTVMWRKFTGTEIKVNREDLVILSTDEVLATVDLKRQL